MTDIPSNSIVVTPHVKAVCGAKYPAETRTVGTVKMVTYIGVGGLVGFILTGGGSSPIGIMGAAAGGGLGLSLLQSDIDEAKKEQKSYEFCLVNPANYGQLQSTHVLPLPPNALVNRQR